MIVEWDDTLEYEVVTMEGESIYFEDIEEAKAYFYDEENNALILNKIATEEIEMKEVPDGNNETDRG